MNVRGSRIRTHAQGWEDWGRVDPLWAVLTEPDAKNGRWDVDAFFASGQQVVAEIVAVAHEHGLPQQRRRALDFGCGVGRLTRALSDYVDDVVGVDVAQSMVDRAKALGGATDGRTFVANQRADLRIFPDARFDIVLSHLVLQHLPSAQVIDGYLREFVRVLAPGGALLFQLPTVVPAPTTSSASPIRRALRPRTRALVLLRRLGLRPQFLYNRLHWQPPMSKSGLPAAHVENVIRDVGATLVDIRDLGVDRLGAHNNLYVVTRGATPSKRDAS